MFLLILDHVSFNEFDFKIIFKLCIELMNTRNDTRLSPIQSDSLSNFGKKVLSYLMQLKIINDTEYKINIRHKLLSKLINNLIGLTSKPVTSVRVVAAQLDQILQVLEQKLGFEQLGVQRQPARSSWANVSIAYI